MVDVRLADLQLKYAFTVVDGNVVIDSAMFIGLIEALEKEVDYKAEIITLESAKLSEKNASDAKQVYLNQAIPLLEAKVVSGDPFTKQELENIVTILQGKV